MRQREGVKGLGWGKKKLLFAESYIMDRTAVAALCRAQRRSGEKQKEERPSIFDKRPFFGQGQLLD